MYDYPLQFDIEPNQIEFVRPERPYSIYGHAMIKGSFGNGISYGEDSIMFEGGPLESRILDVEAEMSAICQTETPEDAVRLTMLELDLVLLNAQRTNISEEIIVKVAKQGIELIDEKIHETYEVLTDEPIFVEQLYHELEGIDDDSSAEVFEELLKEAFDHIIHASYDEEQQDAVRVHTLARTLADQLEARQIYLKKATVLAPETVQKAREESVAVEIVHQALIAA